MKFRSLFVFTLSCLMATGVAADEKKSAPALSDEQMAKMEKASSPGAEHELLQKYTGSWTYVSKWWMDSKSSPEKSEGRTEFEMILGGRFLRQHHNGNAMGKPFEGIGITGYDNVQKQYTTVWLDNMSTSMAIGNGKFDQARKVIADKGSFSCPLEKSGKKNYRAVWTLPADDSFTYEMFSTGKDGKEFRMMQIVYKKD